MFNVLLRAFFMFIMVFFLIRLMGKRQVGELQPYEFVITMMTADLATIPLSDLIPASGVGYYRHSGFILLPAADFGIKP